MKNLSNWRSVRLWERAFERDLRSRHSLWLHGWCIGLFIVGLMWATSHLQIDFFIPSAHSLPHAMKLIRAAR
jgi:hypothetical protein